MDVLEALGGWSNINREKLDQIKVDNPPLYNAITKALNLLAKKYGGEDIVIQKPIEVVEEKATTIESEAESDYAFLKRIEILNLTTGVYVERNDIVDSMMREINLDLISVREKYESSVQQKLEDLDARDLVESVGRSGGDKLYRISNAGQALIDNFESKNKQVDVVAENLEPSELSYLEQSILLSNRRSDPTSFSEIFKSVEEVALQKFQLNTSNLTLSEKIQAIKKLVKDGYLYNTTGYKFIFTQKGEDAINKIVSNVGQPLQEGPSDEDLKLEILLRMADYYDGGVYKLLNQDDIIKYAVKHTFSIPSNKYFGLVVKLL
jgi:predicted transcriptional regulator